jgi:putative flippase GtrA
VNKRWPLSPARTTELLSLSARRAFRYASAARTILAGMTRALSGAPRLPRDVIRQLVRFGIVGCSNTLLSWCAFALLVWLGVHYLLASAVAWTLGALNSYVLNRRWTFRSQGRWAPELVRFGAVQCAGLLLDIVLLDALTRDAHVERLLAQALVYPVTTIATFLLSRHWAFATLRRASQWPA